MFLNIEMVEAEVWDWNLQVSFLRGYVHKKYPKIAVIIKQ